MKTSYVFLAEGFEEVEALTPVDVLRRCGMPVVLVAVGGNKQVAGAHGVTVLADELIENVDLANAEWLICPGGMPGASNLKADATLSAALMAHALAGGRIAAICAAPAVVLAALGLLDGKAATCYPGFEGALMQGGARYDNRRVVVDGNIVTANGPSSALQFALTIATETVGPENASAVSCGMLC